MNLAGCNAGTKKQNNHGCSTYVSFSACDRHKASSTSGPHRKTFTALAGVSLRRAPTKQGTTRTVATSNESRLTSHKKKQKKTQARRRQHVNSQNNGLGRRTNDTHRCGPFPRPREEASSSIPSTSGRRSCTYQQGTTQQQRNARAWDCG